MSLGIRRLRPALFGGVLLAIVPRLHAQSAAQSDSAPKLEVYAEVRVVSRYVWRGYDLSRGRAALQPWVEVTLPAGLTFNAFTTSALDSRAELDEFQLGALYAREVRPGWELSGGYLAYLQPGTETEPNTADENDTLSFNRSGEFVLGLTRSWEGGYASLTYSRGHSSGAGNSLNLWVEHGFTLGDRWTAAPYLQIDYLDEYEAPSGLSERISGLEVGLPVTFSLGAFSVQAAGYLAQVPSVYVRTSNGDTGGTYRALQPWAALAVIYERD